MSHERTTSPISLSAELPSDRPKLRSRARNHAVGRRVAQFAAAGGIVIATIAVAAPSWAGPLSGC